MHLIDSKGIVDYCKQNNQSVYQYAMTYEEANSGQNQAAIHQRMAQYLDIMKQSVDGGLESRTGTGKIIKRTAHQLYAYSLEQPVSDPYLLQGISYAMAVMEENATMGKIVAAPTAGAAGIVPGVFLALQQKFGLSDQKLIEGLIVAGIVGAIIAKNSSVSGAKGGCQAEVGSASAMAAVAGLYMLNCETERLFDGGAIALKNLMGLVCDPVAGLVEVPCQKRNAIGVANAFIAIDMVRAGLTSYIPFDEVVGAMKRVGDSMPTCHKETGTGGVAATETGKRYRKEIFGGFE